MTRVRKHHPELLAEAHRFERCLMNLALLPAEFIEEAFDDLQQDLLRNEALLEIMGLFFDYYRTTWINGKGTSSYSVYKLIRRTNNVLERYHRALKSKMATNPEVGKFMGMYQVLLLLNE